MSGVSPLLALLGRRLLHGVLLLAVLSLLSFILADLAPGDLVSQLQMDPRISADTIEQLRGRYGLDQPWPQRYGRWLRAALRGDLGYSLTHQLPVTTLLGPRLQASLWLGLTAALLGWSLALLGGRLGGVASGILVGSRPRLGARFAALGTGPAARLGRPVAGQP